MIRTIDGKISWDHLPRYDVTGVIHVTHGFEDEQSSSLRVWDRVSQTAHAIALTDDLLTEWISRAGMQVDTQEWYGGHDCVMVHPDFVTIQKRAGQMLGYEAMATANDMGVSWRVLAPALRAARIEVERGA